MNNKQLSREPYRGTRDFYPEDMFVQNYIFSTMRAVAERYGYLEYGASILEETGLYRAKTGSEIVNEQTYSFTDRGGRDVTIRPEMTPTIARMVARKQKELSFPLRWYSIPNLFRYERPQRGRLREHWQLNVDIFGIESVEADAEIIGIVHDLMRAFGAKNEQFTIRINNRKLLRAALEEYLGLDRDTAYSLNKLIDKKSKIKEEEFVSLIEKAVGKKAADLMAFLNTNRMSELPKELVEHEGVKELAMLEALLKQKGVKNYVFDPSLVRGFDYYTGIVFEVFDTNPANGRSLFGGGRYDDLVSMFGAQKVPGVGFGMGDVTIKDYLETYNFLPAYVSSAKLYICRLSREYNGSVDELADFLRQKGVNVAIDYTNRKVPAQIKTAEKQHIPFIVCVGEEEVKTRIFKLKNLATRQEQKVSWEELPDTLKRER